MARVAELNKAWPATLDEQLRFTFDILASQPAPERLVSLLDRLATTSECDHQQTPSGRAREMA
jgi:hypothetical protein